MYASVLYWIRDTPDNYKTQEMRNEAVPIDSCSFTFVPDQYKTQDMRNEVVCMRPYTFVYVPEAGDVQRDDEYGAIQARRCP